jgi:hypothetical protein
MAPYTRYVLYAKRTHGVSNPTLFWPQTEITIKINPMINVSDRKNCIKLQSPKYLNIRPMPVTEATNCTQSFHPCNMIA